MKIKVLFENAKSTFSQLFRGGMLYIFGSSVIAQIGGLISSIIVIRYLPKTDYGYYVSANNLYSYLSVFIGLGFTSAIIQFCSEKIPDARKNAIYRYSLRVGSLFNILLACAIIGFAFCKRKFGNDTEVSNYLLAMAGLPFVSYLYNYFQIVLRVKLRNRQFSTVNVIYTIATVSGNIIFTRFWNIYGLIGATYLSNTIAALAAILILRKERFWTAYRSSRCGELSHGYRQELISYSSLCAVTNFASSMLVLLDITCLGLVLSDSTVLADYKVASTVPSACLFIPSCLITYFYPHMVENCAGGRSSFQKYLKRLLKIFIAVNSFVFVCLLVFAPFLIELLYGQKYMNTVPIFRMLSINYFVYASFRQLLGNTIAVIKKVKINLLHTTIAGTLNVILDLLLIQSLGSIGAAIATVIVTCFTTLLEISYLHRYFKKTPVG